VITPLVAFGAFDFLRPHARTRVPAQPSWNDQEHASCAHFCPSSLFRLLGCGKNLYYRRIRVAFIYILDIKRTDSSTLGCVLPVDYDHYGNFLVDDPVLPSFSPHHPTGNILLHLDVNWVDASFSCDPCIIIHHWGNFYLQSMLHMITTPPQISFFFTSFFCTDVNSSPFLHQTSCLFGTLHTGCRKRFACLGANGP